MHGYRRAPLVIKKSDWPVLDMTNRRVCPISFHFIEVPPPQNILYGLCVKILWIRSDVSSYIIVSRNSDIKAKLL